MLKTKIASAGVAPAQVPSRIDFTGQLAVLLGVVGCGLFALSLPPIPDHAYQFYLGRKLLDGARLYVDVAAADMHPPLFTWLAASIEAIARLFGISGLNIYPAFVALAAAASLHVVSRIGPRSPFFLAVTMLAVLPLAGPYLGQGEHLALVCALPYLVATAVDQPRSRLSRCAIALVAAFGLALKPYFALVAVTTELYRVRQHGLRSLLRLESITIASFFVAYVLATMLFTPQFFSILPWVMELYPRFAPVPVRDIVIDPRTLLLLVALVSARIKRTESEWERLADVLSFAAAAMFIAVVLQGKGWGYHWYPVNALSFVLIGLALRPYVERYRLLVPALSVAGIFWMNREIDRTARLLVAPPSSIGRMVELVEKNAQGRPIVALAHTINAGFPLVSLAGVDWASPYAHLWMIPAIYRDAWYGRAPWRYRDSGKWQSLEQEMFDRVWEGIESKRPAVMLLQVPLENGFDMMKYFATDPRFRNLFLRATEIETVGHYTLLRVHYN